MQSLWSSSGEPSAAGRWASPLRKGENKYQVPPKLPGPDRPAQDAGNPFVTPVRGRKAHVLPPAGNSAGPKQEPTEVIQEAIRLGWLPADWARSTGSMPRLQKLEHLTTSLFYVRARRAASDVAIAKKRDAKESQAKVRWIRAADVFPLLDDALRRPEHPRTPRLLCALFDGLEPLGNVFAPGALAELLAEIRRRLGPLSGDESVRSQLLRPLFWPSSIVGHEEELRASRVGMLRALVTADDRVEHDALAHLMEHLTTQRWKAPDHLPGWLDELFEAVLPAAAGDHTPDPLAMQIITEWVAARALDPEQASRYPCTAAPAPDALRSTPADQEVGTLLAWLWTRTGNLSDDGAAQQALLKDLESALPTFSDRRAYRVFEQLARSASQPGEHIPTLLTLITHPRVRVGQPSPPATRISAMAAGYMAGCRAASAQGPEAMSPDGQRAFLREALQTLPTDGRADLLAAAAHGLSVGQPELLASDAGPLGFLQDNLVWLNTFPQPVRDALVMGLSFEAEAAGVSNLPQELATGWGMAHGDAGELAQNQARSFGETVQLLSLRLARLMPAADASRADLAHAVTTLLRLALPREHKVLLLEQACRGRLADLPPGAFAAVHGFLLSLRDAPSGEAGTARMEAFYDELERGAGLAVVQNGRAFAADLARWRHMNLLVAAAWKDVNRLPASERRTTLLRRLRELSEALPRTQSRPAPSRMLPSHPFAVLQQAAKTYAQALLAPRDEAPEIDSHADEAAWTRAEILRPEPMDGRRLEPVLWQRTDRRWDAPEQLAQALYGMGRAVPHLTPDALAAFVRLVLDRAFNPAQAHRLACTGAPKGTQPASAPADLEVASLLGMLWLFATLADEQAAYPLWERLGLELADLSEHRLQCIFAQLSQSLAPAHRGPFDDQAPELLDFIARSPRWISGTQVAAMAAGYTGGRCALRGEGPAVFDLAQRQAFLADALAVLQPGGPPHQLAGAAYGLMRGMLGEGVFDGAQAALVQGVWLDTPASWPANARAAIAVGLALAAQACGADDALLQALGAGGRFVAGHGDMGALQGTGLYADEVQDLISLLLLLPVHASGPGLGAAVRNILATDAVSDVRKATLLLQACRHRVADLTWADFHAVHVHLLGQIDAPDRQAGVARLQALYEALQRGGNFWPRLDGDGSAVDQARWEHVLKLADASYEIVGLKLPAGDSDLNLLREQLQAVGTPPQPEAIGHLDGKHASDSEYQTPPARDRKASISSVEPSARASEDSDVENGGAEPDDGLSEAMFLTSKPKPPRRPLRSAQVTFTARPSREPQGGLREDLFLNIKPHSRAPSHDKPD